jgi:hypothetical protein
LYGCWDVAEEKLATGSKWNGKQNDDDRDSACNVKKEKPTD